MYVTCTVLRHCSRAGGGSLLRQHCEVWWNGKSALLVWLVWEEWDCTYPTGNSIHKGEIRVYPPTATPAFGTAAGTIPTADTYVDEHLSTFAALRIFFPLLWSLRSLGTIYTFLLPLFFTIILITTRKHDAARSVSQWCSSIPSIHSLGMHVHATVSACTPIVPVALTLNSNRNSAQCTSFNNLSIAAQKIYRHSLPLHASKTVYLGRV